MKAATRGWASLICLWALSLLLAACTSAETPTPTPAPPSAWGEIITLGAAEQSVAPAFTLLDDGRLFSWIGADETGIHQDARLLNRVGRLSERVVLPLPPLHPFAQELYPAAGGAHFLWLDADPESIDSSLRLFSALVNPLLSVERGPVRVSTQSTLHYAALPNVDGSLWVVWSGGLLAEPALYAQLLDALGRPRSPQKLIDNADWPALLRTDAGAAYLYWQTGPLIYRALLGDGVVENVQPVTEAPHLALGDLLEGFSTALDATHAYLFWNITRADGAVEVWYTAGPLEAESWPLPIRLGVALAAVPFVSGFNSGLAAAATSGDAGLRWAAPARGQFAVLPIAAQVGADLALVYMQAGQVVGYQQITSLDLPLIGAPLLLADRALHLHLSWAQPTLQATAELRFTSTQR